MGLQKSESNDRRDNLRLRIFQHSVDLASTKIFGLPNRPWHVLSVRYWAVLRNQTQLSPADEAATSTRIRKNVTSVRGVEVIFKGKGGIPKGAAFLKDRRGSA